MTEAVTITPQAGMDAEDNPLPAGEPFTVSGLVAPENSSVEPGVDGDLDAVTFTVYLPLTIKTPDGWVRTVTALTDNFHITVRGQVCVGRVKEWDVGGRGGVVVAASAMTGVTP